MTRQEIASRVRQYVVENFLYTNPDYRFSDTDSLLRQGIIDSMGVIELITFVQDAFGIDVDGDEITEENFDTLEAIAGFVQAKRRESVAA